MIYTKKDGTSVNYDTKAYHKVYRERHSERIRCEDCDREVAELAFKRHLASTFHANMVARNGRSKPPPMPEERDSVPDSPKEIPALNIAMTVKELRSKAKDLNIKGYSRMSKGQLEELINKGTIGNPEPVTKPAPVAEAAPAAVAEPAKPAKKPNAWNTFLSGFAKEKGLSLKEAMKTAKEAWIEHKAKATKSA
jgi:hypothetical protein